MVRGAGPVLVDDVLPALSVELEAGREVALVVGRGLVDARLRHDFPREVALQEILQAKKQTSSYLPPRLSK